MRAKSAAVIVCLLCALAAWGQESKAGERAYGFRPDDARYKALEPAYREWLNMVAAIASRDEISAFLQLPTVRDRELFIRLFWQQRDPTPGTEANEYRDEIERRFRHVNEFFGRGTPRPAWMTAMGRIYMILGEPANTESFEHEEGVVPAQVWYYYGDAKLGLPAYFNITFFKPHGSGEWEIYDPAANGPAALLVDGDQYVNADDRQIYQILKKKVPTLAGPAFSMTPGQESSEVMPSLRNSLIMANVYRSPVRSINPAYAANFLRYKSFVHVDASASYIESSHALAVLKDDLWGFNLIAFSVKPKKLTIDFNAQEKRYNLSLDLTVALKRGEKEVYPYQRHYELAMTPEQMAIVKSGGVVIHDSFPVAPGDYRLAVFVQNPVNREFCFFEEAVRVQAAARPCLATPVLGYKTEKLAGNFSCAYRAGNLRLAVDPDRIFAAGQVPQFWLGVYHADRALRETGGIAWTVKGLDERNIPGQKGGLRLSELPDRRVVNVIEKAAAAPLPAGFYELTVQLLAGDGRVVDSRQTTFQVSPLASLAQPSELYVQVLVDSPYYMDFILGQQFRRLGDADKALYSFERSLQARPDFPEALQAKLELLLQRGDFAGVLQEAGRLPRDGEDAFAGHYLKGRALFGLRDFRAALDELLAANAIANTDVDLVNLIGRSYLALGDPANAARAFAASLALRKDQPEIEKLLAQAQAAVKAKEK